jgi:cytoskeletal protein RodZ
MRNVSEKEKIGKREMNIIAIVVVRVVICGLIWNNDGCLWFQEEPREEYNNNRGTQVESL